jgi:hypothetical protein
MKRPQYTYIIYVSFWRRVKIRADTHKVTNGVITLLRYVGGSSSLTEDVAQFVVGVGFRRRG